MCLDVSFITKDNTNQRNTHFIATVLFSKYQRISLRKSISIVSLDKISFKKTFIPRCFLLKSITILILILICRILLNIGKIL